MARARCRWVSAASGRAAHAPTRSAARRRCCALAFLCTHACTHAHLHASHRLPSHPIASQPIASQPIASQPIASHPIASHPIASHDTPARERVVGLRRCRESCAGPAPLRRVVRAGAFHSHGRWRRSRCQRHRNRRRRRRSGRGVGRRASSAARVPSNLARIRSPQLLRPQLRGRHGCGLFRSERWARRATAVRHQRPWLRASQRPPHGLRRRPCALARAVAARVQCRAPAIALATRPRRASISRRASIPRAPRQWEPRIIRHGHERAAGGTTARAAAARPADALQLHGHAAIRRRLRCLRKPPSLAAPLPRRARPRPLLPRRTVTVPAHIVGPRLTQRTHSPAASRARFSPWRVHYVCCVCAAARRMRR
jgi:hypothetical protein